jgi:UDP-N-acetylmuramoyl-L-alanyl-D-glutamate--2,6-diaminopimelate ligase
MAVVNIDDPYGAALAVIAREVGSQVYSYGLDAGEFRAEDVQMQASGMTFCMIAPNGTVEMRTRLTGKVNVYNLLAASAAAYARGLSLDQIAEGTAALTCVPGRFQTVDAGQPFTVVVDYAHTDDALRNLIALARDFVDTTGGRVITLFGCGGDRDRAKRPLMGRAAGEGSDLVVLTSDNPRSEDPQAILRDAQPGLEATGVRYVTEVDRAVAIRLALEAARPGDIVLLAGKGHEKTQTLRDGVIAFDDAVVAANMLREILHTGVKA